VRVVQRPDGNEPDRPRGALRASRLDERLVAEGLVESRAKAQARVMAGEVFVDDVLVDKPGTRVRETAQVRLREPASRFVSRGGDKLAGALEDLGVDPAGRACLDVGASTGGFTDCLLQRGARCVVAVDVGHGQLHEKLRADPRVLVRERTNARHMEESALGGEAVALVVVDVSFISVRLLLPRLAALAPAADWLLMVKPQFEVGRQQVGKGGVVRDDALREGAAAAVIETATELGWRFVAQAQSRIPGPKGNREIFVLLRPDAGRGSAEPEAEAS
jgi:23S rRNA (cytidine1920-2'-O)/16S rRNA (cytidine1409-2'-O)-methyltransferase